MPTQPPRIPLRRAGSEIKRDCRYTIKKSRNAPTCSADRRHGADTRSHLGVAARCCQHGATIEAEPTGHDEEGARSCDHHVVGLESLDTRLGEATIPWSDSGSEHEGGSASDHVNNTGTGEIVELDVILGAIVEPGLARPHPVHDDGVHCAREQNCGHHITVEGAAFCPRTRHDRARSTCEGPLKEPG